MEKIYEEEFVSRVLRVEHPVVIDFYADWCGPCKMLSPVLDEMEREFDDYEFFKMNVDENPNAARRYGVSSIPNIVIFKGGEVADRMIGFSGIDDMREFLEKNK